MFELSEILFFIVISFLITAAALLFERHRFHKHFASATKEERVKLISQQHASLKQSSFLMFIIGIVGLALGFILVNYVFGRDWKNDSTIIFLLLTFTFYHFGKIILIKNNLAWAQKQP